MRLVTHKLVRRESGLFAREFIGTFCTLFLGLLATQAVLAQIPRGIEDGRLGSYALAAREVVLLSGLWGGVAALGVLGGGGFYNPAVSFHKPKL